MADHYNVLFLCTGNSARSIMAEAILNHKGTEPRIHGLQRGQPSIGQPRPEALRQIESAGMPTAGLRSKSWDEFAAPGAPQLDFVFTVCDNAAKEQCPYWPGQPMTAHWGIPDPAAVKGTPEEIARAFRDAFVILDRRIGLFLSLPLGTLETTGDQDTKSTGSAQSRVEAELQKRRLSFLDRYLTGWIFAAMVRAWPWAGWCPAWCRF